MMNKSIIENKLTELPVNIRDLELDILNRELEIFSLKTIVSVQEINIKKKVYFDDKNTNKEKRDINMLELINSDVSIADVNRKIKTLLDMQDNKKIELKFLINVFTSLKYIVKLYNDGDD